MATTEGGTGNVAPPGLAGIPAERARLTDATDRFADYMKLPSIGAATRMRIRSVVCQELSNGGSKTVLRFDRKTLELPASAARSIRFMIHAREFEMSALPGSRKANAALCSTLIQEGFLTIR